MCFCKLVKLFYLCSILLLLERICTSIRLVCCLIHLSLSIKYLKWNKGNAKCGVSPRLKIKPCYLDLWPWKSIWFQILLRSKYVPSLVKIHWRMLILECSQGCLCSKNLTPWPWKSIGFQTLIRTMYVPRLVKIHWRMLILECSQGCYTVKKNPVTLTFDLENQ
jgi:hypothetical protein